MNALFPDLVINGETIPAAQVAAETQHHDGPKDKPGIAWRKAANAVAVRTLLLQEARRRRIRVAIQEVGPNQFETEDEALIRGLLDKVISAQTPSEADVRREWERDPSRFRAPPLWEVSHVLVACDPKDAEETRKAKVRASVLNAFATSDPDGFAGLARRESDCPSKSNGGALGQLSPGDMVPEFEAVLREMTQGAITATPVLTRYGWHIIKMDAFAMGAMLPFETVKQKIAEAMEKASWTQAAHQFVQSLVASAEITGADLQPVVPRRADDEQHHD